MKAFGRLPMDRMPYQSQAINGDSPDRYQLRGGIIHAMKIGGTDTLCGSVVGGGVPIKDKRVTCIQCYRRLKTGKLYDNKGRQI